MGLDILPLIRGLCRAQQTLAMMSLKNLPLVGGLCLVQWILTMMGLKDLLLIGIGGLCLAQQTTAIMASNDIQRASMTNDTFRPWISAESQRSSGAHHKA